MNKVILIGRATRDAELRGSQGNICGFSIATNDYVSGEKTTEYHDCTVIGKQAENAAKYIKKGQQVAFEGRKETKEHNDKKYVNIVGFSFELVGSKSDSSPSPAPYKEPEPVEIDDDDIPF